MITATRKLAHELEDGSLEVVLQVHPQHKSAFFAAFPKAGLWVALTPTEKPPTQGAAPNGAEAPPATSASSGPAPAVHERVRSLVTNPWFQQFVDEVQPGAGHGDAERRASEYLRSKTLGLGGLINSGALNEIGGAFEDWCERKGYRQDA